MIHDILLLGGGAVIGVVCHASILSWLNGLRAKAAAAVTTEVTTAIKKAI